VERANARAAAQTPYAIEHTNIKGTSRLATGTPHETRKSGGERRWFLSPEKAKYHRHIVSSRDTTTVREDLKTHDVREQQPGGFLMPQPVRENR
jgi:hypothetical protein